MNIKLQNDLMKLAKLIYDISKKHGGIYIGASCCRNSYYSSVLSGHGLESIEYWGESKEFTKDIFEKIERGVK